MSAPRTPFSPADRPQLWLALALGNSRCLWGQFLGLTLQQWQWCPPDEFPSWAKDNAELCLAAVGQTERLRNWPASQAHHLTLAEVPLAGTYETLGLDRALALVGAARELGWPVLAVDGGTALTISAADAAGRFAGGAIWPGLSLQGRSLHQATAALPLVTFESGQLPLPERWATSTENAIRSGILYSAIAAVRDYCLDWRLRYPNSPIVFLGGDGQILQQALALDNSDYDPTLVLKGIAACRKR